jgi:hypothetical protein
MREKWAGARASCAYCRRRWYGRSCQRSDAVAGGRKRSLASQARHDFAAPTEDHAAAFCARYSPEQLGVGNWPTLNPQLSTLHGVSPRTKRGFASEVCFLGGGASGGRIHTGVAPVQEGGNVRDPSTAKGQSCGGSINSENRPRHDPARAGAGSLLTAKGQDRSHGCSLYY